MSSLSRIMINNIKNGFKEHLLYFTSIIVSIIIFFTFSSIQYNESMSNIQILSSEYGSVTDIASSFKIGSYQVMIFVGIFILYSSFFFIKKRKKEIALYSLLGMKKNKIGLIMFVENIIISLISLVIGILIGCITSRISIGALVKIMDIKGYISYNIEPQAIIKTSVVFLFIALIVSILGYTTIYRFKLIELFKADKTPQKEPKGSIILSIVGIIFVMKSIYILEFINLSELNNYRFENLTDMLPLLIKIVTGLIFILIGIYLFISTTITLFLKIYRKNEKSYYKGLKMIEISNILYRIRSNALIITLITVLTTISMMNCMESIVKYYETKDKIGDNITFSYAYFNNSKGNMSDKELNDKVDKIISKYKDNEMQYSMDIEFIKFSTKISLDQLPRPYYIVSQSQFNEISKRTKIKDEFNLGKNEIVLFNNAYSEVYANAKGEQLPIINNNKKVKLKVSDYKDYSIVNSNAFEPAQIQGVVSDETYKEIYNENNIHKIRAIDIKNQDDSELLTKELRQTIPSLSEHDRNNLAYSINVGSSLSSYFEYKQYNVGGVSAQLFINSLLAIIFLICTGSVLFFKQISEASDDKERYIILDKIGCNNKSKKISIMKQLIINFSVPLLGAIIMSIPKIEFYMDFVRGWYIPVGITIGIYGVIYLIYYLLTSSIYYKIVSSK